MNFLDLAAQRYSVRSYSRQPVEREKIDLMTQIYPAYKEADVVVLASYNQTTFIHKRMINKRRQST